MRPRFRSMRRRDRGAGARIRPGDRRSQRENRRARARDPGPSPHRSRARPLRRARAAVQRRRGILQRRHHHQVAGRHDHRLESGRRTAVRIYRGGSGGQAYRPDRARQNGCRRSTTSCAGSAGAKRSNRTKPCDCARMAARWRFRSASRRSRAPSGAIIGISKTARDITERKRTQQALSQQIEERRRIFETSQDLILVTDPKGMLVQVSPSSEAILGYLPQEMIGHSADRFHPLRRSQQYPRGNARRAARTTYQELRYAIRPQGRPHRDAVVDGRMVRAGAPAFLHRPRHDRKPAGAGSLARKRATGARHRRYRARRLCPDGRRAASSRTGIRRRKTSSAGRAAKCSDETSAT